MAGSLIETITSKFESVDHLLYSIADRETKVLRMFLDLSKSVYVGDDGKYEWTEKSLVGLRSTVNANFTNVATTVVIDGGSDLPKAIIAGVSHLLIGDERMKVTAVVTNATTYSLTVTRGDYGTTAAAGTAGDEVRIMNVAKESADANRDDSQYGARKFNYPSILRRELIHSGTMVATKTPGDENKMIEQVSDKLKELYKELQQGLIDSPRYLNGSDKTERSMGGFRWWATQGGGRNLTKAALNKTVIEEQIQYYLENGGNGDNLCMLVSYPQQRQLNSLKETRIIGGGHKQSEKNIDNFVNTYDFGSYAQVAVIPCHELFSDEAYFFDKSKVKVCPLEGRKFKTESLAKTGDSTKKLIVGEYTAKFTNVKETLTRITGLSLPS